MKITCIGINNIIILDQQREVEGKIWFVLEGTPNGYLNGRQVDVVCSVPYREDMTLGEINDGLLREAAKELTSLVSIISSHTYASLQKYAVSNAKELAKTH